MNSYKKIENAAAKWPLKDSSEGDYLLIGNTKTEIIFCQSKLLLNIAYISQPERMTRLI